MIRAGFPRDDEKRKLTDEARNAAVKHRFARRANALLLLDRGMSCQEVNSWPCQSIQRAT
jgi:hypothetical protein